MMKEKILINVDSDYLQKHKDSILLFLKETTEASFEDVQITEDDLLERFEKLVHYVISEKGNIISYEIDGSMIGYLWYFKNEQDRYHINEIAVNSEFRGKGIGTKLINVVEQMALDNKVQGVEMYVSNINKNAVQLYENKGYSPERMLLFKKVY